MNTNSTIEILAENDKKPAKKLARRFDIFLAAGLVLVGAALYGWLGLAAANGGVYGEIIVDGTSVATFDLSNDGIFTNEALPGVYFEIRYGAVAFVKSDCPMQICVRRGFISQPGQSAVCLPKRSVLVIVRRGRG